MPKLPKVLHIDEIEAVPGPGTLSWLPVRHSLGVHAFGCNAYAADAAGRDVVEPHTEDPELGHEELYFVARGSATFTIDEQTYRAPAGTYVFVPDPASHRHATADEPGTIVLSFGGPPIFEPSAWEWAFRAAALQERDPARARGILRNGLRIHPDSATLHYGLACVDALDGHTEEALSSLRKAIELRSEVTEWAQKDSDLDRIREDERFKSLVGPPAAR
jgi:quercetin dioxygenase-like cupin family protein